MENASLILAATIWRLASYSFRAAVLGLSVLYGDSMLHDALLLTSVITFSFLIGSTLKISELNAMGEPAHEYLLYMCTLLDRMLWVLAVLTLSSGIFHVTGI